VVFIRALGIDSCSSSASCPYQGSCSCSCSFFCVVSLLILTHLAEAFLCPHPFLEEEANHDPFREANPFREEANHDLFREANHDPFQEVSYLQNKNK